MPFDVVSFAAGKKSGDGGGGDIKTQPLNVTENGTYTAPSGRAYTPVNVNVKQPDEYSGTYEITPSKQAQTLTTADKRLADDVIVHPIPDEYIIPKGTLNIDENGKHDVTEYESVNIDVSDIEVEPLDVTKNGTYTPLTGKAYGPVNVNVIEGDQYSGPYEVESVLDNDQTLETNGKSMLQDMVILKIPVMETSNISGGYTVTIGR